LSSSTPSPVSTSTTGYRASTNSPHDANVPIDEVTSSNSHVGHDQVSVLSEDSSSLPLPSPSAIPPRFKYMEKQMANKKEDFEDLDEYPAAGSGMFTVAPTTVDQVTVKVTSISPDSSTFPLPPRFKYMEERVVNEKKDFKDSEFTPGSTIVQQSTEVITEEIPTTSEVSTTFSLPPRFKYMEEQLAHKKQDLEEVENYEVSRRTKSTTVPTMVDQSTEKMLISPEISTAFPIPPRFKYMEAKISENQESEEAKMPELEATTSYPTTSKNNSPQPTISTESPRTSTSESQTTPRIPYPEQEEVLSDSVELHNLNPFLSGGFLPGPAGFVKKSKRVSEEVKQKMMKEMEMQYGPVMEDIKEYGFILKRENDKLSAEVRSLKEELIKTESELVKKQVSWMRFWN